MSDTKFKPGESGNPAGKIPGTKDKFTNLKAAFLEVFDELGGAKGLHDWAKETKHSRAMFYQWITKMLPSSSTTGLDETTRQFLFELSEQFMPKKDKEEEGE